jgi:DNA helicase-2/ATP-dependent DNA helicase PcrA
VDDEKKETRVYGPPGTGKSTWLARQIKRGVEKYGADKVLVSSFSKAAATEIASRDTDALQGNVGTLHALCYQALGRPDIAETKLDEWNREHPEFPVSSSSETKALEDGMPAAPVDALEEDFLAPYNLMRAKSKEACERLLDAAKRKEMTTLTNSKFMKFVEKWEEWKAANNLFDFTDMLVMAHDDFDVPPGSPSACFFDEVQDFNPLMLSLIRKWAENIEHTILCGDDDQTIFQFLGATPDAFVSGRDRTTVTEIVLPKTWRLPRRVKDWADGWIRRVAQRVPKVWEARDEEGAVINLASSMSRINYKAPGDLIPRVEQDLSEGRSVMILASCAYMLHPIGKLLREAGIPFGNKYRPADGKMNPLRGVSARSTPTWVKVEAFMRAVMERRDWTLQELKLWRDALKAHPDGMTSEARSSEFTGLGGLEVIPLRSVFEGADEDSPFDGDIDGAAEWLQTHMKAQPKLSSVYPLQIIKRGHIDAMRAPEVCVGTIHSVKGGEADSVYIFPDLSQRSRQDAFARGREAQDAITRLFYVGGTRARHKLTLLPAWRRAFGVQW